MVFDTDLGGSEFFLAAVTNYLMVERSDPGVLVHAKFCSGGLLIGRIRGLSKTKVFP
jgi:hypothetical protein